MRLIPSSVLYSCHISTGKVARGIFEFDEIDTLIITGAGVERVS